MYMLLQEMRETKYLNLILKDNTFMDIYYELHTENKNKTKSLKEFSLYTSALREARSNSFKGKKLIHLHKKKGDVLLDDLTRKV